jgi:tRNA-dihydrouridine synthase
VEAPRLPRPEFRLPGKQIVSKNGGSALLRDCPLLEKVARAVVDAVAPFPVTAKMRIGWDDTTINAVEAARILEGCGIAAIAVHGRTKAQGYGGAANWEVIANVAAAVRVPVSATATSPPRRTSSATCGAACAAS